MRGLTSFLSNLPVLILLITPTCVCMTNDFNGVQFPLKAARTILDAATPVLRIHGLGGARWTRNVPSTDGRRVPWL